MPPTDRIPMVDLRPQHEALAGDIATALDTLLERGDFVDGGPVKRFEERAAHFLGVSETVGVASGTDALVLALRAAGVGPGDEVITSPFSFWATLEAIELLGARAVFPDIDPRDMNLDPRQLEPVIGPRSRAILPVHVFGQGAPMTAVMELARARGLAVIEDAAQAFGGRYRGRRLGSFGLAGCFSFYPSKPLGGLGDGGLIATSDPAIAERLRSLRNHGSIAANRHREIAYNSRLDSIQAVALDLKLDRLETHLAERRRLAAHYHRRLAHLADLRLPETLPRRDHCFAQYTLRCERRDALADHLAAAGVASAIHYPLPLYRQEPCRDQYGDLHLPQVENCCKTCLSLPLYEGLSEQQVDYICASIEAFFQ